MLHYQITLADPAAHLIRVTLKIEAPSRKGHQLLLPAWIPGSYMIREFARHLSQLKAEENGMPLSATKLDKHTWQLAPNRAAVIVSYVVYAWDLSVRAAHFDDTHAFFNPSVLCVLPVALRDQPIELELKLPKIGKHWRVATTLPLAPGSAKKSLRFSAPDYDSLIDHPFECGDHTVFKFNACGTAHEVVIHGQHDTNTSRLSKDLQAICFEQIAMFGGTAPFDRYLFMTTVTGDGYGGLEHRSSTALLASRQSMPPPSLISPGSVLPESYRNFLGLASHEYFHSWNVKRIMPAAFKPYDFTRENHTRLLWIFEGFTSYYDDLVLCRSQVIRPADYLECLSTTINQVLSAPGRLTHSVADASFEAWIKYYRQDENSPNSQVSYYTKGALVALCLDLTIRHRSAGAHSLDDVMRLLWTKFGAMDGPGLGEDEFASVVKQATGIKLNAEIEHWAYQPGELPLAEVLATHGVALHLEAPRLGSAALGMRVAQRGSELHVTHVMVGSAAHEAGLSSGDVLMAWDGLRVDDKMLEAWVLRQAAGWEAEIVGFRRDELRRWHIARPVQPALKRARLELMGEAPSIRTRGSAPTPSALRDRWFSPTGVLS